MRQIFLVYAQETPTEEGYLRFSVFAREKAEKLANQWYADLLADGYLYAVISIVRSPIGDAHYRLPASEMQKHIFLGVE